MLWVGVLELIGDKNVHMKRNVLAVEQEAKHLIVSFKVSSNTAVILNIVALLSSALLALQPVAPFHCNL